MFDAFDDYVAVVEGHADESARQRVERALRDPNSELSQLLKAGKQKAGQSFGLYSSGAQEATSSLKASSMPFYEWLFFPRHRPWGLSTLQVSIERESKDGALDRILWRVRQSYEYARQRRGAELFLERLTVTARSLEHKGRPEDAIKVLEAAVGGPNGVLDSSDLHNESGISILKTIELCYGRMGVHQQAALTAQQRTIVTGRAYGVDSLAYVESRLQCMDYLLKTDARWDAELVLKEAEEVGKRVLDDSHPLLVDIGRLRAHLKEADSSSGGIDVSVALRTLPTRDHQYVPPVWFPLHLDPLIRLIDPIASIADFLVRRMRDQVIKQRRFVVALRLARIACALSRQSGKEFSNDLAILGLLYLCVGRESDAKHYLSLGVELASGLSARARRYGFLGRWLMKGCLDVTSSTEARQCLAVIHAQHGEGEKAMRLIEEVKMLQASAETTLATSPWVDSNTLGILAYCSGDVVQAETEFSKALNEATRILGPKHIVVGTIVGNLAKVAVLAGDEIKAKELTSQFREILLPILGADHPAFEPQQRVIAISVVVDRQQHFISLLTGLAA